MYMYFFFVFVFCVLAETCLRQNIFLDTRPCLSLMAGPLCSHLDIRSGTYTEDSSSTCQLVIVRDSSFAIVVFCSSAVSPLTVTFLFLSSCVPPTLADGRGYAMGNWFSLSSTLINWHYCSPLLSIGLHYRP